MKTQKLICTFLSLLFLLMPIAGAAMETDQYDLPPVPLADIGDEVSEHVENAIRLALAKVNAEIIKHQACLDAKNGGLAGCRSASAEQKKIEYLRSNDAVAYETYKQLGFGTLFTARIGKWMYSHKFSGDPSQYKTTYLESIYIAEPIDYLTISPTVNLYGAQFGTDKLEHMFQQGYDYYKIHKNTVARGETTQAAAKKAVKWGQLTERTYFGWLVSGVYSNADLVANYAGMRFYQGLTNPIKIGEATRPAILIQKDGVWTFNGDADLRRDLIRPFLTEHLNEALNPSVYSFLLYPSVYDIVRKKSCPQWVKAFPGLSKSAADATTKSLTLWNGEDYGHLDGKTTVTIGETCFSGNIASK